MEANSNCKTVRTKSVRAVNRTDGLELIVGPMFAGKSTTAIKLVTEIVDGRRHDTGPYGVWIVNPKDTRHSSRWQGDTVYTHDGWKSLPQGMEVRHASAKGLVHTQIPEEAKLVIIDEAQFYELDDLLCWIDEVSAKKNKLVIAIALISDATGARWPATAALIKRATTITCLTAKCTGCAGEATETVALTAPMAPGEVKIGGADKYTPMCIKCAAAMRPAENADSAPKSIVQ